MHGSQDELRSILQEKLFDYEGKVPGALTDNIFTKLKSARRYGRWKAAARYTATTVVFLTVLWFFNKDVPEAKSEGIEILQAESYTPGKGIALDGVAKTNLSVKHAALSVEKVDDESNDSRQFQREALRVTDSQSLVDDNSQGEFVETERSIAKDEFLKTSVVAAPHHEKSKPQPPSKFRIGINVMPLLTFSHAVPNGNDGVILSNFKSPRTLADRVGVKVGISMDYAVGRNNFIYGELSYFDFRTAFSYKADETLPGLNIDNSVNQKYFGVGAAVGVRMPLRFANIRNQFVSVGAEAQLVSGGAAAKSAWMLQASYMKEIVVGPGMIRIQPTINYSLTKYQYPGLSVHPFMVGLGIGYVLPVN